MSEDPKRQTFASAWFYKNLKLDWERYKGVDKKYLYNRFELGGEVENLMGRDKKYDQFEFSDPGLHHIPDSTIQKANLSIDDSTIYKMLVTAAEKKLNETYNMLEAAYRAR